MHFDVKRIGDICKRVCSGGTPTSSNAAYYDGGIPWLNTNEVNFCNIYSTNRTISEEGLNHSAAKLIPANSVIVAMYGVTAGKSAIAKIPLTTNQACCNLIIDEEKAHYQYVYHFLKLQSDNLNKLANGGAQQNLNSIIIKKFKINLPSLEIQRRIASILSAYDNLIENNNRRIHLLEQMAENLYKEWFVRFRFPGHEKAEFENGMPKGWKRVKICDVCNVTDGVHNTVIDAPQSKYFLLSSKNIKAGKIVIGDNERTIDEDTFIKLRKRTKMSKGDILLSSVGTIGEVCLLNEEPLYYEFQRSVAIIKPDFSISNSCLLYEMFKVMRNDFVNAAHGAAQQCLFIGDLKKMKICLPSKTISDIFERKVRPIYNMISSISKQNENLSRQRDLLLPRLMSGKLEVKV